MSARHSFVIAVLFTAASVAPAQVLFFDNFNNSSAGWTMNSPWGIGPAVATTNCRAQPANLVIPTAQDPGFDADQHPGGGLAGTSIGYCASTAQVGLPAWLTSPLIDTMGSSNLRLDFDLWYCAGIQGTFTVTVFTGSTWQTVWSGPPPVLGAWWHGSFSLQPWSNPQLRVRFHFTDTAWYPYPIPSGGVSIDNVKVSDVFLHERFTNPAAGWTAGTSWSIGNAVAGGGGSGCSDPGDPGTDAEGIAGGGIAGVVRGGNAPQTPHGFYYLTSPACDTAGVAHLNLRFDRWLNSDYIPYMESVVDVWDGANWINIYSNGFFCVNDSGWSKQTYDVSAYANASFKVRFGFDVTSNNVYFVSSWNIDNVEIYSPIQCKLQLTAYAGPGSIRLSLHCLTSAVPANTLVFNCFTMNSAGFPNGTFFGISPSLAGDVIPEFMTGSLPFVGTTDANGDLLWELPAGVPSGLTVYGVAIALSPAGYPIGTSLPTAFTTP